MDVIIENGYAGSSCLAGVFKDLVYRKGKNDQIADIHPDTVESLDRDEENSRWLLCVRCRSRITRRQYAINVNSSHRHTFTNPESYVFNIRCFRNAPGCIQCGQRVYEYSWFPGYTWQIVICKSCAFHSGWFYRSNKDSFWGLISEALIEEDKD